MEKSKSQRVREFLPFTKPSFLSVALVFCTAILWAKNGMMSDRLSVLEDQVKELSGAGFVENGLTNEGVMGIHSNTVREKIMSASIGIPETPVQNQHPQFDDLFRSSEMSKQRYRRQTSNSPTRPLSIDELRQHITRHLEEFVPTKYCRSSETVCPAGPPGSPGFRGAKGSRGRRGIKGARGRKGSPGIMGPPGKHGKQGIVGPPGPKGEKGDPGTKGTPGTRGETGKPGESISAPEVVVSPAEQTRNEGGKTDFYCTASGNPTPNIEWKFNNVKISLGSKFTIKGGVLEIKRLNYSDAGRYSCVAENILGSAESSGNLTVRGLPIFIQVPPSLVTPVEGTHLQATCQAQGYPDPVLNWTRLIQPFPPSRTGLKDGNLTIRNLSPVDSGLYECVATNSLGTKRIRMNVAVQKTVLKDCDCWRSQSKQPDGGWGYGSNLVDAIDFQPSGAVKLRGYRLWGVRTGSGSYDVTIRLYQGSSLIAEKTGRYSSRSSGKTYSVYFTQDISLSAGFIYTAEVFIQGPRSFYHQDGTASTRCSGVSVTFMKSTKDTNASSVKNGQIPALIFGSSTC